MKHKKTISGLMILVSLALAGCDFGSVSSSAASSSASDITTTTEGTSFSDDSTSDVSSGPIDEFDPIVQAYVIGTPAGLELMREHSDARFRLLNDLDMTGISWVPIPLFTGEIRGFNHKIKNLTIEGEYSSAGFFDTINNVVISDLRFENVEMTVFQDTAPDADLTRTAGVLAGTQLMTFDPDTDTTTILTNIHVTGDVVINMIDDGDSTLETMAVVGGLVGTVEGGILVEQSSVKLSGGGADLAGGIIGLAEGADNNVDITDSFVLGEVFAAQTAGGLIGHAAMEFVGIRDSYNKANVTSFGGIAGGLIASSNETNMAVFDSYNLGPVTFGMNSDGVTAVGGLIGFGYAGEYMAFANVYNKGNVSAPLSSNAGGFIGMLNFVGNLTFTKSYNSGTIVALNNVGGFVGHADSVSVSLITVYNEGTLTVGDMSNGIGGMIGGFFGRFTDSEFQVAYAYNRADISTPTHSAGGFIGNATSSTMHVLFAVHVGDIAGPRFVGSLVGAIGHEDITVQDSYYSAAIDDGQGGVPEDLLISGTSVARGNINDDFFIHDLNFLASDWVISDTSATNMPTLQ
ncbi:MAG TPA: hypothetical protein VFD05_02915 [Bacilli bacterium]|nr:hypothetical protein [Bacilli bacterium]